MENISVMLKNVSKTFKIDRRKGISKITSNLKKSNQLRTLTALHDITFQVKKGEILGILGYDLSKEEITRISDITSFENVPEKLKGEDKNIRKGTPGNFKEYFSDEELKIVNEIMKDNLLRYGYSM